MKEKENEAITLLTEKKLIKLSEAKLVTLLPFANPMGQTNQYYLIKISDQPKYLYRFPGKQWGQGFDRYSENYNLHIARLSGIQTGVLHFNPQSGAQILSFHPDQKPFESKLLSHELAETAAVFKKIHQSPLLMKNNFNLVQVFLDSFSKIKPKHHYLFSQESLIIKRLIFDWQTKNKPLVPSHNEPYLGNFITENQQLKVVDWEYSANNYKEWDLAFFILANSLNKLTQETFLNTHYFADDEEYNQNYLDLLHFKPIVALLFTFWAIHRLEYSNQTQYALRRSNVIQSKERLRNNLHELFLTASPLKLELSLIKSTKTNPLAQHSKIIMIHSKL